MEVLIAKAGWPELPEREAFVHLMRFIAEGFPPAEGGFWREAVGFDSVLRRHWRWLSL